MKQMFIGLIVVLLSTSFVMAQDDDPTDFPPVSEQLDQIEVDTVPLP
jgi:hypothetical protein